MSQPVRTFGVSAAVTLLIWVAAAFGLGWSGLFAVVVLTLLEVAFSFDNAVINARLLGHLSPFWQKLFLTVGIFVAVFVVRFFVPVAIVAVTASMGLGEVVALAFNDPGRYSQELIKAEPGISAFGGMFLLMLAAGFFLDAVKNVHWLGSLERRLAAVGRYDNVAAFALTLLAVVVAATIHGDTHERLMVLLAAVCGIALNLGLGIFAAITEGEDDNEDDGGKQKGNGAASSVKVLVGMAAFIMFLRLEVIDASFSLDGVIGAFAISSSVVIIMVGLGAGALWVRSTTVYLQRGGVLAKYRYLEHGAHWAIAALGLVMIGKLYGLTLPEWLVGSLGLGFAGLAVWSSKRHNDKDGRPAHGRHAR